MGHFLPGDPRPQVALRAARRSISRYVAPLLSLQAVEISPSPSSYAVTVRGQGELARANGGHHRIGGVFLRLAPPWGIFSGLLKGPEKICSTLQYTVVNCTTQVDDRCIHYGQAIALVY